MNIRIVLNARQLFARRAGSVSGSWVGWRSRLSGALLVALLPAVLSAAESHTLTVVSEHGTGTPPVGVYANDYGTMLTNRVSSVDTQGGTQYVATGWVLTTSGGNVSSTLLTESFENRGAVPAGWATEGVSGGNTLSFVTSSSYPSGFTAYDGTFLVMFNSFSVFGGVTRLKMTTPISTLNYTNATVDFAWLESSGYAVSMDKVEVEWSTDGTAWTWAGTFNRYNPAQGWKIKNCVLPAGANGQAALYIAFKFTSLWGDNCHLDLVHLTAERTTPSTSVTGGTGTTMVMTHTNHAVLTWLWGTNYWLNMGTSGSGTVDQPDQWVSANSEVAINATPGTPNCRFTGWSGNTNGATIAGSQMSVPMDQARQITANFTCDEPPARGCCLQVYDFKASIKNSIIGFKLDTKCQKNYNYKFIESNALAGYLVVSCSQCCTDGKGMGELYVYRASDKAKRLFKVPSDLVFADVFVKGLGAQCEPVIGTDAEGLLWVNPDFWNDSGTMDGFFGSFDTGVTTFIATGFGKAVTTKDQWILGDGECTPILVPGCTTLDSLSGSIVGAMNFSSNCNEPYQLICTGDNPFVEEVVGTVNAVTTGTWSIKRSTDKKIVACDASTIEDNILKKLKGYVLEVDR